jgi:AcrR family transcriptional regulator
VPEVPVPTVEAGSKQADVIRAAQDLFAEVGYAKTHVREIANRAHVAIATVYAYFDSGKVAVLQAAIAERISRLSAYVAARTEKIQSTPSWTARAG